MGPLLELASITLRQARRLVFFVVGTTVVLLGVVMIVTPGPAVVVIPAGLGILAVEFAWARRLLRRAKLGIRRAQRARRRARHAAGANETGTDDASPEAAAPPSSLSASGSARDGAP